MEDIYVHVSFL